MRLLVIPALCYGLTALVILLIGPSLTLPSSFEEGVAWLRGYEEWLWAPAMAWIASDSFLVMPSDPARIALGIVYGPLVGGTLAGIAAVSSGLVAFGAARALGRRGAAFLVGERDLARVETSCARWGVYAVAMSRAIGGPAEVVIVFAGLSRMPLSSVLAGLCVGGFTASFLVAGIGAAAVERPALAVMTFAFVSATFIWIGRRVMSRQAFSAFSHASPPLEREA